MAIQDELSEEAKQVILTFIDEALRGHFASCAPEVIDELKAAGYGVSFTGSERVGLSKVCIDEIMYILRTDFFN